MIKRMTRILAFRMDAHTKNLIDKLSRQWHCSKSAAVRRVFRETKITSDGQVLGNKFQD